MSTVTKITVVEPQMVEIQGGRVTLGVPACPPQYSYSHHWQGPRESYVATFAIARHAVTRGEYELFLKATLHDQPLDWTDEKFDGPRLPVCGVSWEDAIAYCGWLRGLTGKLYRLPRADEWEKAARGGLEGCKFPWGDEEPSGRACFGGSERDAPRIVGSFPPNGYGLFDMVGNVWQWLSELYIDIAPDVPLNTPTGKPAELNRALVGGSFMSPTSDPLWVAYRHEDPPVLRHRCLGFRIAVGS